MSRPAAWLALGLLSALTVPAAAAAPAGTVDDPIVDSAMPAAEAFDGLDPKCPPEIRDRQRVVAVRYWGFDGKVHRGQLVVDKDLEQDVVEVFDVALRVKFPIRSVIPISHPRFRKDRTWSDDLSMAADNTSAFNYRTVTGGTTLSRHALGRAIDVNPRLNPYVKGNLVLPPGAKYDPAAPGTLTADHPVTQAFLARGWDWGGNWTSLKDYQHFEKPAARRGEWLRPAGLKRGDTIAFVAPAGPVDPVKVRQARERFEGMGFRVSVPADLARKDRYLAGSDADRAAEFNAAVKDRHVQAIFAVKGGYGLTRILDRIDYRAVRENPKVIAGFSDLTALHLAIARKSRLVTFHAPMPQFGLFRDGDGFDYSNDLFWRTVRADRYPKGGGGYDIPLPAGRPKPECLVPGTARGRLVGGNLTLIGATMGTPYEIESAGTILVVEDTGEKAYRIDRVFSQLRLAGHLDRFAGVILGTFDGADEGELRAVIAEYFGKRTVPVVVNYPVGHTPFNATFPHGGLVELDAAAVTVRVVEPPVRRE